MALNTLTILGNYHHYLYPKVFCHPNHPGIFKLLLILSSNVSSRLSIPWLSSPYRLSYTTHSGITLFIPFSSWFIHLGICLPFSMCYFSSSTGCNTREALRKMLLNWRLAGVLARERNRTMAYRFMLFYNSDPLSNFFSLCYFSIIKGKRWFQISGLHLCHSTGWWG